MCPGQYQRPFLLHLALELPHGEDECMEPVSSFQRMEATWGKKDPGECMGKLVSLEKYHNVIRKQGFFGFFLC